jgi:hypothetical protein
MSKRVLVVGLLALPLLAAAAQAQRGSCQYSPEGAKPGLTYCTHVATEKACLAEAGRKGSADWLAAHPPRFVPGASCVDKAAKAKKKAGAPEKAKKNPAAPANAARAE